MKRLRRTCRLVTHHGLTLVEVVMSTLIVGVMTVAALNALGVATQSSTVAGERAIAHGLADDLMAEILQTAYSDPDESIEFGPEDSEDTSTRADFDDVDDYHDWNSQPPQSADGTTLADRANWRRQVVVTHVQPTNPSQATTGDADQGVKRIQVIVEYNGATIVEQYAVRTDD